MASLPDDLADIIDELPDRPPTFIESKYVRMYAVDMNGHSRHDQYVYAAVNGVVVVGLAPSHPLIEQHRKRPDYQPLYTTPEGSEAAAGARNAVASLLFGGASLDEEAQAAADDTTKAAMDVDAAEDADDADGGIPEAATACSSSAASFSFDCLKCIDFDCGKKGRGDIRQSGKKRNKGNMLKANSLICQVESTAGDSVPIWAAAPGKLLEVNQRLLTQPRLLFDRPTRDGYVAVLYPSDAQMRALKASLLSADQYMSLRGLTPEDLL